MRLATSPQEERNMKTILLCAGAVLLMGCGQGTQAPSSEEPKSSAQNIVDTMSQRNALEDGRKAGQKIRSVSAEQNKDLQEVDSMNK
jgi:starvation-inducible outer membrane lipoprotein